MNDDPFHEATTRVREKLDRDKLDRRGLGRGGKRMSYCGGCGRGFYPSETSATECQNCASPFHEMNRGVIVWCSERGMLRPDLAEKYGIVRPEKRGWQPTQTYGRSAEADDEPGPAKPPMTHCPRGHELERLASGRMLCEECRMVFPRAS